VYDEDTIAATPRAFRLGWRASASEGHVVTWTEKNSNRGVSLAVGEKVNERTWLKMAAYEEVPGQFSLIIF